MKIVQLTVNSVDYLALGTDLKKRCSFFNEKAVSLIQKGYSSGEKNIKAATQEHFTFNYSIGLESGPMSHIK